ncbi:MAG TPA: carbamoyl phosphate synthase small subunit, partial [Candidatus Scatomorpha pullistercoris]|nr:carbamoyl phosphate synthase small subunit [Candidatus Scatomorpha pullistercoris]
MSKAYLLLEDGTVLEGEGFGSSGTRVGELVFTTGVTGCAESLTDPSYRGQMICFTFPMLGNYGISYEDLESPRVHAKAVVVREFCPEPSNFRADVDVESFLKANGVCGICGVDTRRITQTIRDRGVMNAAVTDVPPDEALLKQVRAYRVTGVVDEVTSKEIVKLEAPRFARWSVALMDYGYKSSIAQTLMRHDCAVTVYPADTPAEVVLAGGHDGVMLSNGPGDPAENVFCIEQIKKLLGNIPM